jgi:hypothetical protein
MEKVRNTLRQKKGKQKHKGKNHTPTLSFLHSFYFYMRSTAPNTTTKEPLKTHHHTAQFNNTWPPTRSRGIRRNSLPCLIKTFPAVCAGLIPTPVCGRRVGQSHSIFFKFNYLF